MSEFDNKKQIRRNNISQDYYAGYYWSYHPYESYDMPGRKSDKELKNSILERLRKNNSMMRSDIVVHVKDGMVILIGHVKTYAEKGSIGQVVWNTDGVIKVLNDLQVTEPKKAGPFKISKMR
jgi:osmotically-inducible protein OsmY